MYRAVYSARKLIEGLTPPIVWKWGARLARKLFGKNIHPFYCGEIWRTVAAGVLEGRQLLLENHPNYASVIDGTFDGKIFASVREDLSKSDLVLDIGANVGYYSLYFAAAAPQCRVVAFEPVPVNRESMRLNMEKNADLAGRIHIAPVAIGDRNDRIEMMVSPVVSSMDFLKKCAGTIDMEKNRLYKEFQPVMVDMVSLDTFPLPVEGRVGLVKIDIEGAEVDALEGAGRFIARHRPVFLVEVHSASNAVKLMGMFSRLDYAVQIVDEIAKDRCVVKAIPNVHA